jgi:membrane protein DedA with SNARE-associated domain
VTDWLLALVPTWGPWLLAACTYLACLALPVPASILLLAAGGFAAAGDLSLPAAAGATLAAAFLGDQTMYAVGRRGGAGLLDRMGSRAQPIARARDLLARRGEVVEFRSRWPISALGPYVNLAAGASGIVWARFTTRGLLGEAVWLGLYLGLGYAFTGSLEGNLEAASALAVRVLLALGVGAVAVGLGLWLRVAIRAERPTP